ncbi:MAG: S1C family serine protease [Akkermansiaceae bacterium]
MKYRFIMIWSDFVCARFSSLWSYLKISAFCYVAAGDCLAADDLYFNKLEAPQTKTDLEAIQSALVQNLEACKAATVSIRIGEGFGSGVIVSEDGLILSAAHVTAGVNEEVTVILNDGSEHKAVSMGLHSETDAAMLRIEGDGLFAFVEINKVNDYKLGHWVFALGHSGGFDLNRGPVVRLGRITMDNNSTLHTDCKVIGGDSGGPLFDMSGQLIGIHSRVQASVEQNMHVPMREYLKHWDALKANEFLGNGPYAKLKLKGSGFLGVGLSDTENGLIVDELLEKGPAAEAGLQVGDMVLKFDGHKIADKEGLQELLKEKAGGDKVELLVLRDEQEHAIIVKLGEK